MSGCSCGLQSRYDSNGALVGYGVCMSCTNANGGWNTRGPVTKAACDSLGGSWSPPAGYTTETAPSGSVGPCGAPLNLPCDQYYAFENANISVMTPWHAIPVFYELPSPMSNYFAGLQTQYGQIYINACNANQLGVIEGNETVPLARPSVIDFDSGYTAYSGSCVSFGQAVGRDYCPGILPFPDNPTIANTNVTVVDGHGSPTDTTAGSNELPSISFIPETLGIGIVGIAYTIDYLFGGGGGGGGGPSLPSGPVTGPSAQISAGTALSIQNALQAIGIGIGVGATAVFIAVSWPELAVAGGVVYIVTVYDTDGTTTTLTVQVPANGA